MRPTTPPVYFPTLALTPGTRLGVYQITGSTLEPGAPVLLFPARMVGGGGDNQQMRQYDVAPDGRFLINTELPGDASPITLILNWNSEAKK